MKTMLVAMVALAGPVSAQVLDPSETRVQTTLDPKLKRIGTITPRSVGQIVGQNWSLGCETLDRDFTAAAPNRKWERMVLPSQSSTER